MGEHTTALVSDAPEPVPERVPVGALPHRPWPSHTRLSSAGERFGRFIAHNIEGFIDNADQDRFPWLAVLFASGIGAWFALDNRWEWLALISGGVGLAMAAAALLPVDGRYARSRQALMAIGLMVAAGCGVVWAKSALVGTPPIARAMVPMLAGRVTDRYDQPAAQRFRLMLATREPGTGRAIAIRLTVPDGMDQPGLTEGALVRLRARLMPPAPPKFPGGYDFARAAWFDGLAATGTVLGPITVVQAPTPHDAWLARVQHALSAHVRAQVPGPAGGIAAAFASGDRGGIPPADEQAMRDSGLTHLLSVSGLHVSAVVAGVYILVIRLLALWPWLALRVRLPVLASVAGGLTGVAYTLLTGAQVPTIRSCLGALLVMLALVFGRQPLSLRLLAVAALALMLVWPEAVVGPSFQMSFGSVLAIIVVHDSAPVRAFLVPREEGWALRSARHLFMILLTGLVIDLALMPIALYHFHRAGIYGSMANVIAIPLTTFLSMPAIGAGLLLDTIGMGAPAWWVCGRSLDLLLWIARKTAAQPDAVTLTPAMGTASFVAFVAGMLWLALWHGPVRLWGLVLAAVGVVGLASLHPPDLLISADGRDLAFTTREGGDLVLLRQGRSSFTRDAMVETLGEVSGVKALSQWPGARCASPDKWNGSAGRNGHAEACVITLARGGRVWTVLALMGSGAETSRDLAVACAQADIVMARDKVYAPCRPHMLKADRALLIRTGGLALDLSRRRVSTVAEGEGDHPWWRAPHRLSRYDQADVEEAASAPPMPPAP